MLCSSSHVLRTVGHDRHFVCKQQPGQNRELPEDETDCHVWLPEKKKKHLHFLLISFQMFLDFIIKKRIVILQWFQKQTSIFHLFSISIHQMILAPLGPNRSSSVHQSVIGLSHDKTRCTTAGLKHNTCKHYRYSTIVLLFFIQVWKRLKAQLKKERT